MAEGMNQMSQEQLMLVDGFESLVKALGTEIPIGLAEDLAAVRNGMPMTPEMQRILAEGSMRLGQQLKDQGEMPNMMNNTNPDIMKDPSMGAMSEGEMNLAMDTAMPTNLTPEQMDQFMAQKNNAVSMGAMSEGEMERSYQVDGGIEQMTPAEFAAAVQSGQITPDELMMESSGSTMTPAERQMMEEEAYFKRLMEEQQALPRMAPEPATPQMRPRPRPTAPMQSPRPQMRR